jgi:hypothetical protein
VYNLVEGTVKRKIVSCVLVASLSFYIGCYSTEMVSKDELKAKVEQLDITIFTKDSLEYKFSKENYRIQGDTLSGYGIRRWNVSTDVIFDASLPFADIDSIETREFDPTRTIVLCGGIGLGVVLIITLLFRHP